MKKLLEIPRYLPFIVCFGAFFSLVTLRLYVWYYSGNSFNWPIDLLICTSALIMAVAITNKKRLHSKTAVIHELKKQNSFMQEKIDFYSALNIATREVFWEADLITGKLSYINPYLKEILGYSDEDVRMEVTWWENNLHPEDREAVIRRFTHALNQCDTTCEAEYRFRCKNGQYKVILDRSHIFRDEQGKPYRILGTMQDVTEHRSLEKKILLQSLDHERELEQAIRKAQDLERQRLSTELHDNINQLMLSACLFANHALKNDRLNQEEKKVLEMIRGTVSEAFEEIRNLSHRLSSSWKENNNLMQSIKGLCNRLMQVNPLHIHLDVCHFDTHLLNNHQKHTLYRILQEQLMNIVKHARASLATIRMETINSQLKMFICDNGIGFDTRAILEGIGLRNMQHRAESCNGKLEIISKTGNGTTIAVVFDLAPGCEKKSGSDISCS